MSVSREPVDIRYVATIAEVPITLDFISVKRRWEMLRLGGKRLKIIAISKTVN